MERPTLGKGQSVYPFSSSHLFPSIGAMIDANKIKFVTTAWALRLSSLAIDFVALVDPIKRPGNKPFFRTQRRRKSASLPTAEDKEDSVFDNDRSLLMNDHLITITVADVINVKIRGQPLKKLRECG
jgi:hypothetical protein